MGVERKRKKFAKKARRALEAIVLKKTDRRAIREIRRWSGRAKNG